jgi:L-alanine-DL-glutamate epimerase-like enolase superfamily enzyme
MNRRDMMKAAVALPLLAQTLGPRAAAAGATASAGPATVTGEVLRLQLRHTWTTVMSSSDTRDTILVSYARDGVVGLGEGAPIKRYNETAQTALQALAEVRPLLVAGDPWQHQELMAQVRAKLPGQWALKAALDAALMDWVGKRLGVPLYRYFGLDPQKAPLTTFSIGIDTPAITQQKVREAADFPILKVKVGLLTDEATIAAVRSVTNKPLRVDANEGWQSKEEALRKIKWLQGQGVEFIEQPLPANMHEQTRWLRDQVDMPIFADEACLHLGDIPRIAEAYDGINIKLDKCGGIWEALRMIHAARAHGMKVMMGCMISSSAAIAAAVQLSPLVDYCDLDGFLLIGNDPFAGLRVEHGKFILSGEPGLGITRQAAVGGGRK